MQPTANLPLKHSVYYLCVDGGATKTAVTITDTTGAIRARVRGGTTSLSHLGVDGFLKVVKTCVEAALRACGVSEKESSLPVTTGERFFAGAWFGVAGVDTPEAIAEITPRLASLLSLPPSPPHLILGNDTTLLAAPLVTASRHDPSLRTCVAVVAGTGTCIASFRLGTSGTGGVPVPQGIARVGGWGWILGDEGAGIAMGREAVRQLLRQHEMAVISGKPLSPPPNDPDTFDLRTCVLNRFAVKSAPELLAVIHEADPTEGVDKTPDSDALPAYRTVTRQKRLSQLAPLVMRAAFGDSAGKGGGDPLALSVLKVTSEDLAEQIALVLAPPTGPTPSAPLAVPARTSLLVFGGSPVGIPQYRDLVLNALKARGHVFPRVEHVANAAETGGRVLWELFNSEMEP